MSCVSVLKTINELPNTHLLGQMYYGRTVLPKVSKRNLFVQFKTRPNRANFQKLVNIKVSKSVKNYNGQKSTLDFSVKWSNDFIVINTKWPSYCS